MKELAWLRSALPLALTGVALVGCERVTGPAGAASGLAPAGAVGAGSPSASARTTADTSARPADGAHPADEPAHPPSGDWCGDGPVARRIAYPESPEALGCPRFLDAEEQPPDAGEAYEDLPRSARAFLDEDRTRLVQVQAATRCCYRWREKSRGGLPLAEGGVASTAPPVEGSGWLDPGGEALRAALAAGRWPPGVRRAAAEAWLEQGLVEHASVAQFSRLALRLAALGAPRSLVEGALRAAGDEVRHASLAFTVASHLGGRAAAPGPLTVRPLAPRGWPELALEALEHGLAAEATAALLARRAAARAVSGLAEPLGALAADERRHVALAARLLAYAVRVDPRAWQAVAVRRADALSRGAPALRSGATPSPTLPRGFTRLGLSGRGEERRAAREAWTELALPFAGAALAAA